MSDMRDKIAVFEQRAAQLEAQLVDPKLARDRKAFAELARELSGIRPVLEVGASYRRVLSEARDAESMLRDPDPDLKEMARAELESLEEQRERLEQELRLLLVPKDPNDEKNVDLRDPRRHRGRRGGALRRGPLSRMYVRYAERRGWKMEPLSSSSHRRRGLQGGHRHCRAATGSSAA